MMKYYFTALVLLLFSTFLFLADSCTPNRENNAVHFDINAEPFQKISDYGFFTDSAGIAKPNKGVISYRMVNSMFSDYALRENFIYLPQNRFFSFDTAQLLNLPLGSCLINVVYYAKDERNPARGKQLLETQLLVKKQTGWETFNYIWNGDQKDALLSYTESSTAVKWTDKNGLARQVNVEIPSKDECRHCHWYADRVTPLGIKAGNLNLDVDYRNGKKNQLQYWTEAGFLKNYALSDAPKYQNWKDTTAPVEQRVWNYLNANCAYCHNPKGTALMKGLFLTAGDYSMESFGICKHAITKGKATCYLKYDILPGKASESIMVCRMASTEFGVKMPELGRTLVDDEGVSLITGWINQLKGDCR